MNCTLPSDPDALLVMEHTYQRAYQAIRAPGFQVHDDHRICRVSSPVPSAVFNTVLSTQVPIADQPAVIAEVLAAHPTGPLGWRLGPATTHRRSLRANLIAAGFRPAPSSTAVLGRIPADVALHGVLPDGVEAHQVVTAADFERWFGVLSASFGIPEALIDVFRTADPTGVEHLFLTTDGTPTACCSVVLHHPERIGGLFDFAVAPGHRGTGQARWMLALAATRLRVAGATAMGQFATPRAAPVYVRLARARTLGTWENWIR